jgi:hypothetical protein
MDENLGPLCPAQNPQNRFHGRPRQESGPTASRYFSSFITRWP